VHSKAFRRLRHKTQVFVDPEGDHFRTRLTHTLEAAGIARGVARALRLNEDLTEAIAVGHDVGNPPFGHAGEEALDELLRERGLGGFRHNEHSLRVVERLERDGRGLNLTWEVRDGILKHTGPEEPETLEGRLVRLVDRFAYINHDIDDAVAQVTSIRDLPAEPIALLGDTARAASTRSSTMWSRARHARATSSERRDRRRDALAPRLHVRARVPRSGPARHGSRCDGSSRSSSTAAGWMPKPRPTTSPG
jgi:dGTP triphosphohydrolase